MWTHDWELLHVFSLPQQHTGPIMKIAIRRLSPHSPSFFVAALSYISGVENSEKIVVYELFPSDPVPWSNADPLSRQRSQDSRWKSQILMVIDAEAQVE